MHICHVNLAGGFSGGERQTVNLVRELANRGIRQTLVARPGNRLVRELADAPGLEIRECPHFLLGHGGGDWDLIHCHDGKAVYWGWLESVLRKTPYLLTRRVDNPLGSGWLTARAYSGAARIVCLSSAIESGVRQRLGPARTVVIPSSFSGYPADPDRVAMVKARYPGKRLVGQAGRLLRHKGYHVTIEAARQMEAGHPDVQFLFMGEGPDEPWLRELADGAANIHFVGHRDDIGDWLAALDVFVFPSLSEGLGSTVLEAFQHGVPVVGARAGGIPDLIDDQGNGLLVPPGDAAALRSAIGTLLSDPTLSGRLTTRARQGLQAFSPETVADRYQTLYGQVLAGTR